MLPGPVTCCSLIPQVPASSVGHGHSDHGARFLSARTAFRNRSLGTAHAHCHRPSWLPALAADTAGTWTRVRTSWPARLPPPHPSPWPCLSLCLSSSLCGFLFDCVLSEPPAPPPAPVCVSPCCPFLSSVPAFPAVRSRCGLTPLGTTGRPRLRPPPLPVRGPAPGSHSRWLSLRVSPAWFQSRSPTGLPKLLRHVLPGLALRMCGSQGHRPHAGVGRSRPPAVCGNNSLRLRGSLRNPLGEADPWGRWERPLCGCPLPRWQQRPSCRHRPPSSPWLPEYVPLVEP